MMYNRLSHHILAIVALVAIMVTGGCDLAPDNGGSLFDPNREFTADPQVTAIEPAGGWLAGVGTLTITGQNFSTQPSENLVFFNGTRAIVEEATATQLRVRTPNVVAENIAVRIGKMNSERFVETTYRLQAAVQPWGALGQMDEPYGMAAAPDGSLYVFLFSEGQNAGIHRIAPDNTRSFFAASPGFTVTSLAVAPDGMVYGVTNQRAIFRWPAGGGARQTFTAFPEQPLPARSTIISIDIAPDGTVWGGGDRIYQVSPAGVQMVFPFEGNVRTIKVMGSTLYVLGIRNENRRVWTYPINADGTLGEERLLLALDQHPQLANALVAGLAVSNDGDVFFGTNLANPLVRVTPAGQWEFFFPGILRPSAYELVWGDGPNLYLGRTVSGPNRAGITRINTLMSGGR
jgi:hypothetical protein